MSMKSHLYHGFSIKGYRHLRTRYEMGEIIFGKRHAADRIDTSGS